MVVAATRKDLKMEKIACAKVNKKDMENYMFKALPYILVNDDLRGYNIILLDDGNMQYSFHAETCQVLRTTIGDVSIIVPDSNGITFIV